MSAAQGMLPESRQDSDDDLRVYLPAGIVAALAARDFARMRSLYPDSMPESDALALLHKLLYYVDRTLSCLSLPEASQIYARLEYDGNNAALVMDDVLADFLRMHPDLGSPTPAGIRKVLALASSNCGSDLLLLIDQLEETRRVNCLIPSPRHDSTFQDPRRLLFMLRWYWPLVKDLSLKALSAPRRAMDSHPLLWLIVNLRERISLHCDAMSLVEGVSDLKSSMTYVVDRLLGNRSLAGNSQLMSIDTALELMRVRLKGSAYTLTPEENSFLHVAQKAVRSYCESSGQADDQPGSEEQLNVERIEGRVSLPQQGACDPSGEGGGAADELAETPIVSQDEWGYLDLKVDVDHCVVRRKGYDTFVEFERDTAQWHTFHVAWRAGEAGATMPQWLNGYPEDNGPKPRKAVKTKVKDKLRSLEVGFSHGMPLKLIETRSN